MLWVLPIAIVGCRIYYVISEWDRYKDNLIDIFKIWEGGIAMYGGTIAGVLTVIVWSRCKKIPIGATLDVGGSALILGQVIGRWANFVNREAFGYETDIFCRMGLTRPGEETVYVHPTFLYESLWNLVGFLIIDFYWYRKDHRKYDGQIFLFYVFWYGTGRAMVEGLRTDSLYIPGTNIRTSQLVAACSAVIALIILLVNIKRPHKPTFASVQAARRAAAGAPAAGSAAEIRRRYRRSEARLRRGRPRTAPAAERQTPPAGSKNDMSHTIYNTYQEEIKMSDYSELLNSIKAAAGSAANIARDLAGNATEKARNLAGRRRRKGPRRRAHSQAEA